MDAADAHSGLDIDHLPRVGIQEHEDHDVEDHDVDELDWPTDVESAPERQWWRHAGAKEQAIRDLFGISPTRYYQSLNALLDHPAALSHEPALVKRLRRLRATRQRSRNGR
jgi:hypothetical protein